jgi:hypothetical protein
MAYTASNNTNLDGVIKRLYRDSLLNELVLKNRPVTGRMPKFEGFGGSSMQVPLVYGDPQGRSVGISHAMANATQVKLDAFQLTRVSDYSVSYVSGEAIESTRGDKHAFIAALKRVIDGTINNLANSIETKLFRDGSGYVCQLDSAVAPTAANPMVLTLANVQEAVHFDYGASICASSAKSGAAVRATPAVAVIAAINRTAGTITTDYDNSGSTTVWAVDDYLSVEGDGQFAGATATCISGMEAWVPSAAPSGTFFGVTRSTDSRLYGLYYDGSALPIEEAGINAQSDIEIQGGKPDTWWMHPVQMRKLVIELGSKKEYCEVNARDSKGIVANIGYAGVALHGQASGQAVSVIASNRCQLLQSWMVQSDEWELASLGALTQIIMDDGLKMLRVSTADDYEIRSRFRGNLCCKGPIHNAQILMPAI